MTEPWERIKMALAEAGRPDLADEITPPVHPGAIFSRPRRWRVTLDAESWATIHKAASLVRPPPHCVDCFTSAARQRGSRLAEPCEHA